MYKIASRLKCIRCHMLKTKINFRKQNDDCVDAIPGDAFICNPCYKDPKFKCRVCSEKKGRDGYSVEEWNKPEKRTCLKCVKKACGKCRIYKKKNKDGSASHMKERHEFSKEQWEEPDYRLCERCVSEYGTNSPASKRKRG